MTVLQRGQAYIPGYHARAARLGARLTCASVLLSALLTLLAGCGGGGGGTDSLLQHREGSLFRSGNTYDYSGEGAEDSISREAAQYTLNGIVFYLVDYDTRLLRPGGFYVTSAWNGDADPETDATARPPDGQLTLTGNAAQMTIELGGGPANNGLRLSGSFLVEDCNRAAAEALAAMAPASFPGMHPAARLLLGRASQPLTVHWQLSGFWGGAPVDIAARQDLTCESYDYTLNSAAP